MTEKTIPNVPSTAYRVGSTEMIVAMFHMPRVSMTSPASIIMKFTPQELHPWKVFWFNAEFGGYSSGGYHKKYEEALKDFLDRVQRHGFYTGFEPQWVALGDGSLPAKQTESEVYPPRDGEKS